MNDVNSVMESETKKKIKISKIARTRIISCITTVVIVLIGILVLHKPEVEPEGIVEKPDFSEVAKIGELATLKCYYHNVAEYEKEPDGLFQYGLLQVGKKKFWIEYTGTVEIGIDVSKVEISEPNEYGIVRVYVPEVEIFRINQDSSSIQEPVYEKSWFTSITTEEKTKALSAAQENMEVIARADQAMVQRARENAKTLIEQYIINIGVNIGQDYKVEWVDTPEEVNLTDVMGGTEDEK